jgi:6-carboxyhexanoate--CoA ligase
MNGPLYSIRMRASREGRHVSGAERLVDGAALHAVVRELVDRARDRGASPDQVVVTIDALERASVRTMPSLDLTAVACGDIASCRAAAVSLLEQAGVAQSVSLTAMQLLDAGPSPSGGVMRGAMIMDAGTGERYEPDRERGVRASRFDWDNDASRDADRSLATLGLSHFRTKEALALATKIAGGPGVVAELCWSDDAGYSAGYVASTLFGYVRLPRLKAGGSPNGGRAIFVDRRSLDLGSLCRYLRQEAILIASAGSCRSIAGVEELAGARGTRHV